MTTRTTLTLTNTAYAEKMAYFSDQFKVTVKCLDEIVFRPMQGNYLSTQSSPPISGLGYNTSIPVSW